MKPPLIQNFYLVESKRRVMNALHRYMKSLYILAEPGIRVPTLSLYLFVTTFLARSVSQC